MAKLTRDQLDPRNNLQAYSPQAIRNADVWTPQMLRSEYSRLRSIARKRLERLERLEPESYAYRHNKDRYDPVRTLSVAQLKEKLPQLARFIAAKVAALPAYAIFGRGRLRSCTGMDTKVSPRPTCEHLGILWTSGAKKS